MDEFFPVSTAFFCGCDEHRTKFRQAGCDSMHLDYFRQLLGLSSPSPDGLVVLLELLRRRHVRVDEAVEVDLAQHRPTLVRLLLPEDERVFDAGSRRFQDTRFSFRHPLSCENLDLVLACMLLGPK